MSLSLDVLIVASALLLEFLIGYPAPLFRRIRHPVVWMGALLARLERRLNRSTMPKRRARLNGALAITLLLAASMLIALGLQLASVLLLPPVLALAVLALLASTLIAQRSLYEHVTQVATALERDGIDAARVAVAKIVGRDTKELDASGIARAAIESLAENFSDGVVAPTFWGVLLGVPGMAGYKAVNTADSMIGHKTARHAEFGWASAKLDDLLNFPAARLAAVWIVLAALFHAKASSRNAFSVMQRDAVHHRSPNAGWPEAAMAGALGFKLSGPRSYHGSPTNDAWIGDGRTELASDDIRRALGLYRTACLLQIAALWLLALFIAQV